MMTASVTSPSASAVPATITGKLNIDEEEDDDDDRRGFGGPFENAKRKSSWSATSMRKELGSPRMATGNGNGASNGAEPMTTGPPFQFVLNDPSSAQAPPPSQTGANATTTTIPPSNNKNSNNAVQSSGGATSNNNNNDLHRKKTRSCGRAMGANFLQELGSALVSCGGGRGGSVSVSGSSANDRCPTTTAEDGTTNNNSHTNDLLNAAGTSWVLLKDSIHKAVKGDLNAAKEAWRRSTQSLDMAHAQADEYYYNHYINTHHMYSNPLGDQSVTSREDDCDDSILTYDNYSYQNQQQQSLSRRQAYLLQLQEEEEAMQLRRLTSWGTVGTYETLETNSNTVQGSDTGAGPPTFNQIMDPDDPVNNSIVLNEKEPTTTQQPSQQKPQSSALNPNNNNTRRKRVVRFDYPPISSLRECPRTQPDQIGDLFFTEHELEQIEDDRYSTISADDVEIVAISTSTTAESESASGEGHREGDNQDASCRGYVSTPSSNNHHNNKHSNKKETKKSRLRNFSFDEIGRNSNNANANGSSSQPQQVSSRKARRGSKTSESSSSNITDRTAHNNHGETLSSPASAASPKRMIKSVQIYLRERSVG